MAEPVALGIKVPEFDFAGNASKGMSLGLLGIKPLQIAAELRQQKNTALEAERAYGMQVRKDEQRKAAAAIQKQFQKKDADGKDAFDFEGGLAEMRRQGIDADTTAEVERNWLLNSATRIKDHAEKDKFLQDWMTDTFSAARGMKDPGKVAQYLHSRAKQASAAFGIPEEEMTSRFTTALGVSADSPLKSPQELLDRVQAAVNARTISEKDERGLMGQGTATAQLDPKSAINEADRKVLGAYGINVPAGTTREQLNNLPGFKDLTVGLPLKQAESQIIPGAVRGEAVLGEAEATAALKPYDAALALKGKYQTFATKPGVSIQQFLEQNITQPAERVVMEAAIADYNRRNPGSELKMTDGAKGLFAVLGTQRDQIGVKQKVGQEIKGATSFRDVGAQIAADAARADIGSQRAAREAEIVEIDKSIRQAEKLMSTSSGKKYEEARAALKDLQDTKAALQRDIKRMGLDSPKKDGPKSDKVRLKGPKGTYELSKEDAERALKTGKFTRIQ